MIQRVTVAAFAVVATVAAAISYDHVSHLAGDVWWAWLLPFSIDGLLVAGSLALWIERQSGKGSPLAWASVVLGLLWSLGANLASTNADLVPRAVIDPLLAVWPPIALGLAFELLIRIRRSVPNRGTGQAGRGQGEQPGREQPVQGAPVQGEQVGREPEPGLAEQVAEPVRPPTVLSAQDDPTADFRRWVRTDLGGRVPSQYEVRQRYRCGARKANRLLASLDDETEPDRATETEPTVTSDRADRATRPSQTVPARSARSEEGVLTS